MIFSRSFAFHLQLQVVPVDSSNSIASTALIGLHFHFLHDFFVCRIMCQVMHLMGVLAMIKKHGSPDQIAIEFVLHGSWV
jgi:hypothetical protein